MAGAPVRGSTTASSVPSWLRVVARLESSALAGSYDLALANPPYYADFRIAALFVEAAREALAPGGTLLLVTKQPGWYLETLPETWRDVAREIVKNYHLIEAVRDG